MPANLFDRLLNWARLWAHKKCEVARFDGIGIADLRENGSHFKTTLLAALKLVKECDPIRYRRVRRYIDWIVNCDLELGKSSEYDSAIRTCSIDFCNPDPAEADKPWHQTWYSARHASMLVHEATHGVVAARGIPYNRDFRSRIERFCVLEENRFLRKVAKRTRERSEPALAEILECLERDFDSTLWDVAWNSSRWRRIRSLLCRSPQRRFPTTIGPESRKS